THVVQNDTTGTSANSDYIIPANHPGEQEADAASHNISTLGSITMPTGLALKREPPSTTITFGEKEGSTIHRGPESSEEKRNAMILANLKSAELQGRINIQQYLVMMLKAVKDFKESAQRQIDAIEVEPKSFDEVIPGLFRTI